ncbi:MAG: hypothetical protein WD649_01510 [Thermoleophilaceae bacterium]
MARIPKTALLAVALALAASVYWYFNPPDSEEATLVDAEGSAVLAVLATPVLLTVIPLFGSGKLQYRVGLTCAWLLLTFALVTIGEIGLGYFPAGAVLLIAGLRNRDAEHHRVRPASR